MAARKPARNTRPQNRAPAVVQRPRWASPQGYNQQRAQQRNTAPVPQRQSVFQKTVAAVRENVAPAVKNWMQFMAYPNTVSGNSQQMGAPVPMTNLAPSQLRGQAANMPNWMESNYQLRNQARTNRTVAQATSAVGRTPADEQYEKTFRKTWPRVYAQDNYGEGYAPYQAPPIEGVTYPGSSGGYPYSSIYGGGGGGYESSYTPYAPAAYADARNMGANPMRNNVPRWWHSRASWKF